MNKYLLFTILFAILGIQLASCCAEQEIALDALKKMHLMTDETDHHIAEELKKHISVLEANAFGKVSGKQKYNPLECQACKLAINRVRNWAEVRDKLLETIEVFFSGLCTDIKLFPKAVCDGLVYEQAPIWLGALWRHYMNADFICPAVKYCEPVYEKIDMDALIQDILKDKPQNEQLVPSEKETVKFIHWADLHTDLEYVAGNSKNCADKIECCRVGSGEATSEEDKAGHWGSLASCDVPTRTFEKMIDFVRDYLLDEVDFAIWTGDNTSHNIWAQSPEQNVENTSQQTDYMKKTIPEFQVYPIFGNHEGFPVNIYRYYDGEEAAYKKHWADLWRFWIGDEAADQLQQDGFYEISVPKLNNLKLIALNSQSCDQLNWVLEANPTDPDNMLQKLRESLYDAEKNDQPVYIFYHVPTNGGCLNDYATVLAALTDRFSYNIRGQFSAHTHADQLGLFYDQSGNPINAQFVAPSFTTYSNRNPSFRVFEADKETMQILNIHQYRLDLDYWNQFTDDNTELLWEEAYDFLSEYNLENMWDLTNLQKLQKDIGENLDTYNTYMKNFNSGVWEDADKISKVRSCEIYATNKEKAECMGRKFIGNPFEILAGPWLQKAQKKEMAEEQFDIQKLIKKII